MAWLQATCLDERYRDGYKSVYNAKKANKLLPNNPPILDTLAAAYAETGDFKTAIELLQKAINLVNENSKEPLKPLTEHLDSYKQNKPWRELKPIVKTIHKQ